MPVAPLTSLPNLYAIFEVAPGDSSQDVILNLLLSEASQILTEYCHRASFGVQVYSRLPTPWNTNSLTLPELPVLGLTVTGNVTSGSASITNLSSTTGLFVGQSLMGTGIPSGAVITALSGSTLTFGALVNGTPAASAATATNTGVSIALGIALWHDDAALGGWAPGAFGPGTQLQEGVDFWLQYDTNGPGTPCNDGLVHMVNNWAFRAQQWTYSLITPQNGPTPGNYKAVFAAGYSVIPPDLNAACEFALAHMRLIGCFGRASTNVGDGRLSVGLSNDEKFGLLSPQVRSMLAPYRNIPVGAG